MGQAKRRGTLEQRQELAIERKRVNDYLDTLCRIRKARMQSKESKEISSMYRRVLSTVASSFPYGDDFN